MNGRPEQIWFRAGQVTALAALAVLGLADLYLGLGGSASSSLLSLAEVGCALAVAAVWLPAHRPGSQVLPALSIIVALCSLSVTAAGARDYEPGGSWGLAETAGLLGLLFVVVRRSAPLPGLVATPLVAAAMATQPLSTGVNASSVIFSLILSLFAAGAMAAGGFVRLVERGRERELAAARAEQRAEFARDLHDFIAHHVTGIVVQAQGAQLVATRDPERAITALRQIEQAGAETMAAMRRMVGVLRGHGGDASAPLAPLAGIGELGPLVARFSAGGPPAARLLVEGDVAGLPVEVTSSAYRVVMEALTNVRQHSAGASTVDVVVRRTPDWLLVRVADDGHPRSHRRGHGFGLVGLTERVRAVGGRIQAGPGIGRGWVVDAALPLSRTAGVPDGSMAR
ncbi:MAG TPA: histidine kinase [Pilimelia sp.]|nr:histidine kinase [Pilimelia sp.]